MPPLGTLLSPTGLPVVATHCPICSASITVDAAFAVRECGCAVMRSGAGVLVATPELEGTRARLSQWVYGVHDVTRRIATLLESTP